MCDPLTDTCVEGGLGRCGNGAVVLTNLRTDWVTPNQARLSWEAEGLDDLFGYEVEIGTSEEALLAGEVLRVVTSEDNPELARNRLLNAMDGDPVLGTTITGLDPDTTYRVRLVAEDNAGELSCAPTIGVRTNPAPSREVALTHESEDGANPRPTCVTFEDDPDGARTGDRYWQWIARCGAGADGPVAVCEDPDMPRPTCWENIRIENLSYELDLSPGQFQNAFLELWVDISGSDHGYWGQIGLSTPDGMGSGQRFFGRGRLTFASGAGYRRYQIPLDELSSSTGPLDPDTINLGLRSFRIGTEWDAGAIIRIDDAAIRW